jgi:flagellar motor switch protein FliG
MDVLANDLKYLPPTVIKLLQQIREIDKVSHTELEEIKKEEEKLLNEITEITKNKNKDFDEAPYQEKLLQLTLKRNEITKKLEKQVILTQSIYNLVDNKISYLGRKPFGSLFTVTLMFSVVFLVYFLFF